MGLEFRIPCRHKEGSKYKCSSFTTRQVLINRSAFYANTSKIDQDTYLCRLLHSYEPQDKTKPSKNMRKRTVSCSYNLFCKKYKIKPVCKKMFIAVFSVNEKRLNIINRTTVRGNIPKEKRGGDRKSYKSIDKKESLRNFIKCLPARESHHNRQKSKRIYLSSDLNCKKLMGLYNSSVASNLQVKKTMFYKIFYEEFNVGFSAPSSDACNVCVLWGNRSKNERDSEKKQKLMVELRVHKIRAKAFYTHMKGNPPNSISLCFDLQQVQALPKTPIQDAFYSRQISLYNFCVVPLNSKDPWFYTWDETIAKRGPTEIGSAVYDYLSSMNIDNNVDTIRLFCDGCGGQNKNNHIIHSLMQWLYSKSPAQVKEIHIFFPVRGHSFLPADRVFGRLEKELRKIPVITTKDGYHDIFKNHGNVRLLGNDWQLLEIKDLKENLKNVEGLQKIKRVWIKKTVKRQMTIGCEIKASQYYRFDGNDPWQTLLKRGKRIPLTIDVAESIPQPVSEKKKKDVINLLEKQFGEEWTALPELQWYKTILLHVTEEPAEEHEYDCVCNEEDVGEVRV